jgi:hypothetical protein
MLNLSYPIASTEFLQPTLPSIRSDCPFGAKKSLLSALKARKRGYYQNRRLDYFNSMTLNWICRFLTNGQYSTFFSNA